MNILNSIPNNIQNSLVDEQKKDNDQENGGPVWRLAQEEAADESTKHKNFEENNSSSLIDGTVRPGIVNQPVSGDSLLAMTLDRDSNGRQVPNLPDGNGYGEYKTFVHNFLFQKLYIHTCISIEL